MSALLQELTVDNFLEYLLYLCIGSIIFIITRAWVSEWFHRNYQYVSRVWPYIYRRPKAFSSFYGDSTDEDAALNPTPNITGTVTGRTPSGGPPYHSFPVRRPRDATEADTLDAHMRALSDLSAVELRMRQFYEDPIVVESSPIRWDQAAGVFRRSQTELAIDTKGVGVVLLQDENSKVEPVLDFSKRSRRIRVKNK